MNDAANETEQVMGDATAPADPDSPPKTKPVGNKRFNDEQIKEIRRLRALRNPETNAVLWSHAALAKKFDTTPGLISQIVRNRSYKDPDYTPVNDGK